MWPFHERYTKPFLTTATEVPLKNFYIFDEKMGLGKFSDTYIKTPLVSLAK